MANEYVGPYRNSNLWSVKYNWSSGPDTPPSSPTNGDDVLLPGARAGYTVILDIDGPTAPGALASLTLVSPTSGTTELEISQNSPVTLTVSGSITLQTNTEIFGYGTIDDQGQITGSGTVEASNGELDVDAGTVYVSGAALTFSNDSTYATSKLTLDAGDTTFNGANSILNASTVSAGNVTLGTISDFQLNAKIEVKGLSANDSFSISGYTLTITGIDHSQTYTFAANTEMQYITVSESGGVDSITICFMAGTMIRTPTGEVAVEALKRGDLVVTAEGVAQPVTWLGRQTIAAAFADPMRNWPIRVKAGALGEDAPLRDLLVSPDHALLVEDLLIHAGALVNGTSIVREAAVPDIFVYYHVELDDHALILAENAPAETFIDSVDRLNFDNWAEHEGLYPDGKAVEELGYPRAKSRRQVPAEIRAALDKRAGELGLVPEDLAVA